jgi:hypothetical protein
MACVVTVCNWMVLTTACRQMCSRRFCSLVFHRPCCWGVFGYLFQVCDEGHRLKAKGGNKTIDSLLALSCAKRIVLTGTPVQNNLDEFYGAWACPLGS